MSQLILLNKFLHCCVQPDTTLQKIKINKRSQTTAIFFNHKPLTWRSLHRFGWFILENEESIFFYSGGDNLGIWDESERICNQNVWNKRKKNFFRLHKINSESEHFMAIVCKLLRNKFINEIRMGKK